MPRRLLGILIFLLVSVFFVRAQGDIVLLKIGEEQIYKSEYEYFFNRSLCPTPQEFLDVFITYKAKALYAKDLGLDTLPDVVAQRLYYLQVLDGMVDKDSLVRRQSDKNGEEWVELWHITYPLEQHADETDECKAKVYMDSISSMLKKGDEDNVTVGKSFWIPRHYLLTEWNKVLEELDKQEISKPFYSPIGLHIVSWKEKKIDNELLESKKLREKHLGRRSDYCHRVKEIEDALLVMALSKKRTVSYSEMDLDEFFNNHYRDYRWEYPHYRGAVFHCENKKVAKAIKKYLKRYDYHLWESALNGSRDTFSGNYKMECGLFQIGKNEYVDKLVFKCGSFEPLADYPYTFVMGKKMKAPESYKDVRDKVVNDYLNAQEKSWNDAIKHNYKVEINEEALKSVNNSGNI